MAADPGRRRHVTVIGAGNIGTCCALTLRREGYAVTLVDQADPGEGCSYGNSGCISPAAVVPMSMPGMLGRIPGWLADPLGPLAVRWRYLPRAAPWLLRWAFAGSDEAKVRRNSAALFALNGTPFDHYRALLSPGQFADLIKLTGHLYVWRGATRSAGELLGQALRDSHGIRTNWLDARAIREIEPAVAEGYACGLHLPDNGYTPNPERLVKTLAANFRDAGGEFVRRRVRGFDIGADGPRAVETDAGPLPVDLLVVAAGAWSVRLGKGLGIDVPLETERGYHIMLERPNVAPRLPVMDCDQKYIATPMEHGLRLAGTVEIAGLDAPPDDRRARALLVHGKRLLAGLDAGDGSLWMGCRPSLPDSVPVIDRSPRFANVYCAFGHGHLGMTGGPGTGRLLADLVAGRTPGIDPVPYRISRFR